MSIKETDPVTYNLCVKVWEESWAGQMTVEAAVEKVAAEWKVDPEMLAGKYALAKIEANTITWKG